MVNGWLVILLGLIIRRARLIQALAYRTLGSVAMPGEEKQQI